LIHLLAGKDHSAPKEDPQASSSDIWGMLSGSLPAAPTLPSLPAWFSGTPSTDVKSPKQEERLLEEEDRPAAEDPPWAKVKDKYDSPRLPLVFVHGLLGFDTLGPSGFLQVTYWRGLKEAFEAAGVECLFTALPASASIAERAEALHAVLKEKMWVLWSC
jgi:hypothetical protein